MWRYGQEYSGLSPLKCSCGFLMTPAVWQWYSWPMTQWPVGWNSSLFRSFLLRSWVNEREPVRSWFAQCLIPQLVIASCQHWPGLQHPEFNCLRVEVFQYSNHQMIATIVMITWAGTPMRAMIHLTASRAETGGGETLPSYFVLNPLRDDQPFWLCQRELIKSFTCIAKKLPIDRHCSHLRCLMVSLHRHCSGRSDCRTQVQSLQILRRKILGPLTRDRPPIISWNDTFIWFRIETIQIGFHSRQDYLLNGYPSPLYCAGINP